MTLMKKTQGKDAIRNIRKQIVSFLSMACVTLLGVTGLLQIRSIMTSLERSVDEYYAETRFRDVEIACAAGLSEKSLSQIQSLTPVSEAEGVIRLDMVMIPAGDPVAE